MFTLIVFVPSRLNNVSRADRNIFPEWEEPKSRQAATLKQRKPAFKRCTIQCTTLQALQSESHWSICSHPLSVPRSQSQTRCCSAGGDPSGSAGTKTGRTTASSKERFQLWTEASFEDGSGVEPSNFLQRRRGPLSL